eukprot:763129-Hanusia_phi.AAC.9
MRAFCKGSAGLGADEEAEGIEQDIEVAADNRKIAEFLDGPIYNSSYYSSQVKPVSVMPCPLRQGHCYSDCSWHPSGCRRYEGLSGVVAKSWSSAVGKHRALQNFGLRTIESMISVGSWVKP